MKRFLTLCMTVLLLVGCAANKDSNITEKKDNKEFVSIQNNDNTEYQEFVAENKDFRVTTYINKLEFSENEEIKIYSTFEYIGEEETISIWSGEPYFYFEIFNGQEYFNQPLTLTILKKTVLKKGEIYTFPFTKSKAYGAEDSKADFWKQYCSEKELKLPNGEYTFSAYAAFTLDKEQEEHISVKTEFIVKVK
ncbi:hypothetical protein [Oceanirhabdus sp. W0125-5]|uniref:hypothetical protein n=1 Tax=Oceanirhabdus sp. W0125-5 TaxID=2999116 RepID=UPI0022F2C643|nr:hypothetical protein [Oceanirhabdus sp. W0125-5]WBW95583.1 hypothetical protein OW730_18060 [Oceanirhabdus sp. W0125-5]